MGVDASEAYDGKVGQTYEFKTMLHAIHFAGGTTALNPDPIVIYRTRGIYAWVGEGETLPNWATTPACKVVSPTTTPPVAPAYVDVAPFETVPKDMAVTVTGNIVYGASTNTDGTYPTVACQPFNLYHPTYPRDARQCSGCHVAGFATIPDQSIAVATTIDAGQIDSGTGGSAVWRNQLDDTLQGPAAAACTSCHSTTSTRGHAYNESWIPQTFPNGRQTILDQR
jgi:hypothetical protein